MFNHKLGKRPQIKGNLQQQVGEDILAYIRRNPDHQVPNTAIASRYGIAPSQVSTVTKYLLRHGNLERVSRSCYKFVQTDVVKLESLPKPTTTFVPPVVQAKSITDGVVKMAKDFAWEMGSDSLREFVLYIQSGKR